MTAARLRSGRLRLPWLVVVLATFVAFGWQSFVTQTHIHVVLGAPNAASMSAMAGSPRIERPRSPADSPADCPICRDMAAAGHYLSPAPTLIVAPVAVALWLAVAAPLRPVRSRRSHAWRSRAPPRAAMR